VASAKDWRVELINELQQRQLRDGNWVNESDRWMEGDSNLVTSYALIAAQMAYPYGERLPGKRVRKDGGAAPTKPLQLRDSSKVKRRESLKTGAALIGLIGHLGRDRIARGANRGDNV
jgi:hypothetical protein